MNLHTFAIAKMKEDCTVEKRFQSIIQTLDTAYRCLEDLMDCLLYTSPSPRDA